MAPPPNAASTTHPLRPRLALLAILAPCLPSAVRVLLLRCAIVFFDLAAEAAFLIFLRAAARCFAELIAPSLTSTPIRVAGIAPESKPPLGVRLVTGHVACFQT